MRQTVKNKIYNLVRYAIINPIKTCLIIGLKILSLLNPYKRNKCSSETKRCEHDFFNSNYRYSRFGQDSPSCCNTHLYEILRDVISCLDQAEVQYYIFYGTYLGAIRHQGGFIPWDTDVDICVLDSDKERCLNALQKRLNKKYPIESINDYWWMVNYSNINTVHADLYFMSEMRDEIFLNGYETIRYQTSSIFPLRKVRLYALDVWSPCSVESLIPKYGKDFMETATLQYAFFNPRRLSFNPAKLNL